MSSVAHVVNDRRQPPCRSEALSEGPYVRGDFEAETKRGFGPDFAMLGSDTLSDISPLEPPNIKRYIHQDL